MTELMQQPSIENWNEYARILTAQAADPHSIALKKAEARCLVEQVADLGPDVTRAPLGYFNNITGGFLHAQTVDKARKAIDAVLAVEADAELMYDQGELLMALHRFPEAGACFTRAADTLSAMLEKAPAEARATLADGRDEALGRAALCARGPQGMIKEQIAEIYASMGQLAKQPGAATTPEMKELASLAEQREAEMAALESGPDPARKAMLEGGARKLAGSIVTLLVREPIALHPLSAVALNDALEPELQAAGMSRLALFDDPLSTGSMGEAVGQLWTDAGGVTALTTDTAGGSRFLRTVTELSDGSMIMTANIRGRSFWQNADEIETVLFQQNTAAATLINVHQALVARRLALQPNLAVMPVRSLAQMEALENRIARLKNAFRLAHGVTAVEILGLNVRFRDVFTKFLQAELAPVMAQLRAAHLPT